MANKYPYMPLYAADWLLDTVTLTPAQRGAYFDMLCHAWTRPSGTLPNDDSKLAIYARMTAAEWAENKDAILAFWKLDKRSQSWSNKRAKYERHRLDIKSESARDSAAKRWNKTKKEDANAMQTQCERNAIQSQSQKYTDRKSPNNDSRSDKFDRKKLDRIFEIWNGFAASNRLQAITKWNDARRKAASARVAEVGIEEFEKILTSCQRSAFLMGKNDRGWKLDFDFFVTASKFQKIAEGGFEIGAPPRNNGKDYPPGYLQVHEVWFNGGRRGPKPDPDNPETWQPYQVKF